MVSYDGDTSRGVMVVSGRVMVVRRGVGMYGAGGGGQH